MAKRKLSEAQRQSIRNDLKKALADGASNADALKTVGKKYGVHPESVRWYLKELTGGKPGRRKKPRRTAAGRKPGRRPGRPRGRKPGRSAGSGASALLRKAQAAARDKARKATALMRIMPSYRKLQQSETDIRTRIEEVQATQQKLARTLERTAKERKSLETKLKGLL